MFAKFLIVATLLLIVVSLGFGLFYLLNDGSRSRRTVQALTVRIGMSIALFFLLLLGYQSGILRPHGIRNPPSASTQPVQPGP
jgi:ABC-type Na+ efflux pump permease subunit